MQAQDIPYGFCHCGCGGRAPVAARNDTHAGMVKGEPRRFINGHGGNRGNRLGGSQKNRKHAIAHEVVDLGYVTPCWRWLGYTMDNGYGSLKVGPRNWLAHRHYYTQQRGAIPDGHEVDHLCRQPCCVNPDHLEAVLPVVNKRRSGSTKLAPEQISDIRSRANYWGLQTDLAREFGVDKSTISVIRAGKTHKPLAA